jgi:3-hydroxymyristoyl/3-hydroxydecanoyl-(acyl carrier protein) dehydratase
VRSLASEIVGSRGRAEVRPPRAQDHIGAHFGAFSFVDRITSVQNATDICGRYVIPSDADEFPGALVGEAVCQLAAWAAMSALKFTHRPVAGLAGRIEFSGGAQRGHFRPQQLPNGKQLIEPPCGPQNVTAGRNVRAPLSTPPALGESSSTARSWSSALRPRGVLELAANLESLDTESVVYNGTARLNGRLVVRLVDCLGPMVPLADLDDPQALAKRFEMLCGPGAAPGGFRGLPPLALERTAGETGRVASATFQVPPSALFFADHFPRRPVFPGSLFMHLSLQLGAMLASELPPPASGRWGDWTILDMKLRSFIPPGTALELNARLKPSSDASAMLALEARSGRDLLATASLVLKPDISS